MSQLSVIPSIVLIGSGATLVMDVWLTVLRKAGIPTLNFAMIGRWAGHLLRGKLAHEAIAKAVAVPGERSLGWLIHYAVGIGFAGLLVLIAGPEWIDAPSLGPALLVGLATVTVPLLVMQPAMGSGFFASETPNPLANCVRSVANHAVFGGGLYLAATLLAAVTH